VTLTVEALPAAGVELVAAGVDAAVVVAGAADVVAELELLDELPQPASASAPTTASTSAETAVRERDPAGAAGSGLTVRSSIVGVDQPRMPPFPDPSRTSRDRDRGAPRGLSRTRTR
jgi:hypothetical protein